MYLKYTGVKIRIKLSGEIRSKCPTTRETDYNKFMIEYVPRDKIIEVVMFREYLTQLYEQEITTEEVVNLLNKIVDDCNPFSKEVVVVDDSLGVKVEVIKCL